LVADTPFLMQASGIRRLPFFYLCLMETVAPSEITPNFIDVERLIASKNEHLLKVLPGFIIRWLKRITHQELMNEMIYRNRDKFGLDFIEPVLREFGVNVVAEDGKRKTDRELQTDKLTTVIPPAGRLLVASNHPLGGLDGMVLMQVVGRVRPDIVFPVNDLLMSVPGLKPLFIPINKHGRNAENLRIIEDTFASEKTILYFPAGLVSRKQNKGVIRDLEWHKTFITKARRYERDVLPVYMTGRNSAFFYNLANWRRRLGIKANIEMLYLVDEMVKQKDQTIRVVFGDIIPYKTFDRSRTDAEWARYVRDIVYDLNEAR
jgi:putative hemolysin